MKHTHKLIVIITLQIAMTATAFGATADEIVAKLRTRLETLPPFKALYQQSTITPFSPKPITEMGWVYQTGQTIRKEIQKPDRKLIIQSPVGGYQKDLTTGVVNRTEESKAQLASLSGMASSVDPIQLLSQFQFTIKSETDVEWILAGAYQTTMIEVTVSKKMEVPTHLKMTDSATQIKLDVANTYEVVNTIPMVSKMEANIQMKIGSNPTEFKSVTQYSNIQIDPQMDMSLFSLEDPK